MPAKCRAESSDNQVQKSLRIGCYAVATVAATVVSTTLKTLENTSVFEFHWIPPASNHSNPLLSQGFMASEARGF